MPSHARVSSRGVLRFTSMLLIVAVVCCQTSIVFAGNGNFRNGAVGGISIDAAGVVGPPSGEALRLTLDALRKEVREAADEVATPVKMRMVSLRGLAASCEEAVRRDMGRLPEEVRFLAGLQRIEYVFVDPAEKDIILAGPAEGWRIDDHANVVGITTGRPVLRLDDLLVALRYVNAARVEGISCSIDPTEEGYRNLNKVLDQARRQRVAPPVLESAMKNAFGPQQVTITGVPATSHFARVLVAADYRMKRIAMRLDKAPVDGLTSYLDLIKRAGSASNVNPRWWLACNYSPLAASEDGLAWQIKGPGVKAMTEDDFVAEDGTVAGTGRKSAAAQKWADMLTDRYSQLSVEDAVFGELRNLMDMCVVAALLEKNRLWETSGLNVPVLTDARSELKLETWNAPKAIAPEVSFLRTRRSLIVTASGGVQVESWQVASNVEPNSALANVREQVTRQRSTNSLWWQ